MMSFRLMNVPAVYIDLMNRAFKDYFNKFVIVFIDGILVYSKTMKEEGEYLRAVLQLLADKKLHT